MADAHSIRKCKTCGNEFEIEQRRGRPPVNCPECNRQIAESKLSAGRRKCATCGAEFDARRANQKHCSDRCRAGIRMTREQYRDHVRKNANDAKGAFVCLNCGKCAFRRISATNKAKGYENKYCSRSCQSEYLSNQRAKRNSEQAEQVELIQRVLNEIRSVRRLGVSTYKPKLKRCSCKKCGGEFIARLGGGLHKQFCEACLAEKRKSTRRIQKAKRRAQYKGASAESVDPIKVFNRDKWRCRICGNSTPRRMRGTYEDSAPELDHIIPLSAGGSHSYANTQCACRKCNGKKGSKPLGQLMLIG